MQGMIELGEEIFHMPVRMGVPRNIGGLSDVVKTPRYATGVGLLLYGLEQHQRDEVSRVNSGSFGDVMAIGKPLRCGSALTERGYSASD